MPYSPCLVSPDDAEVVLLSSVFERSLESALDQISSLADRSVDCAVGVPVVEGALAAEVVLGICRVWTDLRRVLRPEGTTLLVVEAPRLRGGARSQVAWRAAFALQKADWILRNALIGLANPESLTPAAIGYFLVPRNRYFFDVEEVRAKYGTNPGDVVLLGADSIVDRFLTAARPCGGLVVDLFNSEPGRRRAA